ncbi:MAG: HD domain-containing protein [Nitrospinota bacterium]|nr:HD domain-containing protein [Nitrospinota bacterium]
MNQLLNLINATVLVADDTKSDREMLVELFNDLEANTFVGESLDSALNLVEKHRSRIDIILVDLNHPENDSIRFIKKIRAIPELNPTSIILLSNSDMSHETLALGVESGANDFLRKPINQLELVSRSLSMLRQKKLHERNIDLQRELELEVVERNIELEQTKDAALFGFAKLAEARDPDTTTHLECVRDICAEVSRLLYKARIYKDQINEKFISDIYKAAPLHDIGKVSIPDSILLKPGALTPEEFEFMKKHSAIGAETLEKTSAHLQNSSFLAMARDICHYHHERWDGKGYPKGLKGEEIPLAARIMSLADVFDALVARRVYKDPLPAGQVAEIIKDYSGKNFDPVIAELFLENIEVFHMIKNRLERDDA